MKKTFLTFVLILCVSTNLFASRGFVPISIKDKSGKQVALYKESHALVIGVSEYVEGWATLPGALRDVDLVQKALEENGFHVVTVENPGRRELLKAFEDFINHYGNEPDARLLFYFAGHGHTLTFATGLEMGYIVPVDAPNPHRDERGFRSKALDMQLMEVYAKRIQSKHALFVFDSCFSGSIFALSRATPENISFKTSKPVRQFITAGSAYETVPDESIFRGQFIAALKGEGDTDNDGYLTGVELGEFLQKKVVNYSNGSQHPQYGKIRNPVLDKGDFVFSLLDRGEIEESVDSIVQEREKLERTRFKLEKERKRVAALQRLQEEKRKLEEEKRQLKEEQEKLVRLQPSGKTLTPKGMIEIPGGEFVAGLNPRVRYQECMKYYKEVKNELYPRVYCKLDRFKVEGSENTVLVESFYIDRYEVTQVEFKRVMGRNPSKYKGKSRPVDTVSWNLADKYCRKLGKRLPTDAEWEKAAKGRKNTVYPWGNEFESGKANFCDANCSYDSNKRKDMDDGYTNTAPVGSYARVSDNLCKWS